MKNYTKKGLILILIGISIASCKKDNLIPNLGMNSVTNTTSQKPVNAEDMTILGKQLENPYTVTNMQKAFELISDENVTLSKTDLYVRFLPANIEEVKQLEDLGLELLDTPIDYEILEYGAYYHDPEVAKDEYTWFYVVVKPNFVFPDIKHEILEKLFLPFNIQNTNQAKIGDLVSVRDLETKALEITNNLPERERNQDRLTDYFPDGYIMVENNVIPTNPTIIVPTSIPVKNTRVRAQYWFHFDNTFTDNDGHFHIDDSFWWSTTIKVFFENENVNIRAIRGLNMTQIFLVVNKEIGEYDDIDMENINYVFQNSLDNESEEKAQWMACNTINSMNEYDKTCIENGLPRPLRDMNVWLTTKITSDAAAPMIHKMGQSSLLGSFAPIYLVATSNPLFGVILQVLINYSPDITYDYNPIVKSSLKTDLIANTLYHEFTHSSHYAKVGNTFWAIYIGYIVQNMGYGQQSSTGSGRIEVSETWAETVGDIFTDINFPYPLNSKGSFYTKYLEWETPSSYNWFREGVMLDMIDNSNSADINLGYIDNVNTYTLLQLYNAMDYDVISLPLFKTRVLQETNNQQQSEVNDLFTSYGI